MEKYRKLKSHLSEEIYKDLELFWLNNIDFSENQADKFVNLIEKIHQDSKEVKLKNLA